MGSPFRGQCAGLGGSPRASRRKWQKQKCLSWRAGAWANSYVGGWLSACKQGVRKAAETPTPLDLKYQPNALVPSSPRSQAEEPLQQTTRITSFRHAGFGVCKHVPFLLIPASLSFIPPPIEFLHSSHYAIPGGVEGSRISSSAGHNFDQKGFP